jgi:hypothetical protein
MKKYAGKYLLGKTIIEIIWKDGKLLRHLDGTPNINLLPESNTRFFYEDRLSRQIEFELDGYGKELKAYLIFCGIRNELKRK